MARQTEDRRSPAGTKPAEAGSARRMAERQEETRKGAVTYRPSDRPRPEPPPASTPGGRNPEASTDTGSQGEGEGSSSGGSAN